ncbi:hypothetical protein MPER_16186, partial [Moniliophthora perniciosa FA553]
TPNLKKGHVVAEGCPGFGGKWPEYIPPKEGDSRYLTKRRKEHFIQGFDCQSAGDIQLFAIILFLCTNYAAGFLKRDFNK